MSKDRAIAGKLNKKGYGRLGEILFFLLFSSQMCMAGPVLKKDVIILYTHPSLEFDKDQSSRKAVRRLNEWGKKHNIYQVLLFSGDEKDYFVSPHNVDLTIHSFSGEHQMVFDGVKKIIMMGGYFSLCLCETFRDVLKGLRRYPVALYFVTDGVYENMNFLNELYPLPRSIDQIIQSQSKKDSVVLENMSGHSSPQDFLNFIEKEIFDELRLCPFQGPFYELNSMAVEFKVFGEKLKKNKKEKVSVFVEFLNLESLKKLLNSEFEIH